MRAIQLEGAKQFKQIEVERPEPPGDNQALVRVHRVGICGTDYAAYLGKMPFFKYPRIPGHELGVEVLEVGDEVTNVKPGDRCSIEPYMNCGDCYPCRRGHGNCCERLKVLGVMQDGGLRERFLVRSDKLHPSETLTFQQLALVETLGIGCHATDRADPGEGDHVLIIGAGPIGLATLEFTRLTGATITVMDMVQSRLDFCKETYGVSHTIRFEGDSSEEERIAEITGGDRYAVAIDATGNPRSMSGALSYVAHTGTLVYVGITSEEVSFPHPVLHRAEATLKASRNALPGDFRRIIALIEDGTIDTGPWITHRTTFDKLIDEFDQFTRSDSGVLKAMVEMK